MPFEFDITERLPTSEEVHDVIATSEAVREHCEVLGRYTNLWGLRECESRAWLGGWFDCVRSSLRLYVVEGFDYPECGPSYEQVEPSEVELEVAIAHIRDLLLGS